MLYTLVSFKPEKKFWDRGDKEILPARINVSCPLTKEEALDLINKFKTEEPLTEYRYGEEEDEPFTEFYIFRTEPITVKDLENSLG